LDYIIERKIADDLAASILDGRLTDQRYRLINTALKNVIYLVEGKASLSLSISQKVIDSAIISMKMNYRLKVIQTNSIRETIKRLSLMTLYI